MLTRAAPVASARVSDASSRMPPDSSTLTSSRPTTSASSVGVRAAPEGGVQVDQVHPLGAVVLPGERRLQRVAVGRLGTGGALDEAYGLAVGDVDGRQQGQGHGILLVRTLAEHDDDEGRHRDNDHGGQDDAQRRIGHQQPDRDGGQQRAPRRCRSAGGGCAGAAARNWASAASAGGPAPAVAGVGRPCGPGRPSPARGPPDARRAAARVPWTSTIRARRPSCAAARSRRPPTSPGGTGRR